MKHSIKRFFSAAVLAATTALTTGHLIEPPSAEAQDNSPFSVGEPTALKIKNTPGWMEIPPTATNGLLNFSSTFSNACSAPDGLAPALTLKKGLKLKKKSCNTVLEPQAYGGEPGEWRLNYSGVFTQHIVHVGGIPYLLSVVHNENKNEDHGGKKIQNTVAPSVSVDECASGSDSSGVYRDCWPSYFGFISIALVPYDAEHKYGRAPYDDKGPIVWSTNGYFDRDDDVKLSDGVRHPHGFVADDGHVYVFYVDGSYANDYYGVKVARKPIDTLAQDDAAQGWQTYCRESDTWVDSLPHGLNGDTMNQYYGQPGGCASSILGGPGLMNNSFAVARTEQGRYVGVAERVNYTGSNEGVWELVIVTSNDLVNWENEQVIRSFPGGWTAGDIHYPNLANDALNDNRTVNEQGFYIVGTSREVGSSQSAHMNVMRLAR